MGRDPVHAPTAFENMRPLIAALPEHVVVIDTSNHVPQRDGANPAIDAGQVESEWVQEFFGRPITKAWNAIGSDSFATNGKPKGQPDRIAIPLAGDNARDRAIAITLVEDTGFDGFDAGIIAETWRQQPASPAYCTDLTYAELGAALASAERDRLSKRRDLALAVMTERTPEGSNPDAEWARKVCRVIFM